MNDDVDGCYPVPHFRVLSASGRYVGFGWYNGVDACEIYEPDGDDGDAIGYVSGSTIETSGGNVVGSVENGTLFDDDGVETGRYTGNRVYSTEDTLMATSSGGGDDTDKAGAALLLIFRRWNNADGSPNLMVR